MFIVKKIISTFLMPLPFCILLMSLGIYLYVFKKKHILGGRVFTCGGILLLLLAFPPCANLLMYPLESVHEKFTNSHKNIEYIAVLGGGKSFGKHLPVTSLPSSGTMVRLMEGVRIHKMYPQSKMIFSGFEGFHDTVSSAEIGRQVALTFGVADSNIILFPSARDTKEEADLIAPLVKGKTFVLVTSASHMVRASLLFQKNGVNPIEAPTNFMGARKLIITFPNSFGLRKSRIAIHEYIGLCWAWIRGYI